MKLSQGFMAALVLAAAPALSPAQTSGFDLEAYEQFLVSHQNLETPALLSMHNAGTFQSTIPAPLSTPLYLDVLTNTYSLTPFELDQIRSHGFVVTSRLAGRTFVEQLWDIYREDLPLFISTDAILQAIHNSYDAILMQIERSLLASELLAVLDGMHGQLPALAQAYTGDPVMLRSLQDVDVYLTVPLRLLGGSQPTSFTEADPEVEEILSDIRDLQPKEIALFGETKRAMDFSQFTVRGHYTEDSLLAAYFRAMIWLGRTELYLFPPQNTVTYWPPSDIQRQTIDAALLAECIDGAGLRERLGRMEGIIRFLVGEQDNVTLENLSAILQQTGVQKASDLLDTALCRTFQTLLLQNSFAFQRINSQILVSDPFSPDQVVPASAFLLLGQRFVIDSYITGNVVYDRILYQGNKVQRMLPTTLDVLFALGNDAAGQLLVGELNHYHYGANLAALRYLVDSYDESFWMSSMFNGWLRMIRSLNPPRQRASLPAFMRTAAWWQEKMNTQLASWAQLRHDNLLYAKQSYSGVPICSFPSAYVEPIPEFFASVRAFADSASTGLAAMGLGGFTDYFENLSWVAGNLEEIAQKELQGIPLSVEELSFLQSTLVTSQGCGDPYTGWYPTIYYQMAFRHALGADFVVADVHTAPSDSAGRDVGWVLHVGTGPVDMAIVSADLPGGGSCAFVGPVMNYYEHLSTNYKRLTDEEWATLYNVAPSLRPPFISLYSADESGQSRGPGVSLVTGIHDSTLTLPQAVLSLAQNYPNPFNSSTIIPFTISGFSEAQPVVLEVFDIQGALVARPLVTSLPSGTYTARWDGTSFSGLPAASGVYFYRLKTGSLIASKKLTLLR